MRKKLSIILVISLIIISLCSCVSDENFNYSKLELNESVLKVELVFVERDSYCGEMSIKNIQSLSTEQYESFFERLSNLTYEMRTMIHPENVVGTVIMLKFEGKDNFDLVGTQGIEYHRADSDMKYLNYRCNTDEYENLIKEFFDYNFD